ncbi:MULTISPECIES: hypothetical protein [unclassified Lacinutrix]
MKKLILLFSVVAFTFSSCGSDDDGGSTPVGDPFVANWQYYKYFEDGVEVALEPCEGEETFQVLANGTVVFTSYEEDLNGNCQLDEVVSGTWSNGASGFYYITLDGDTETWEVQFDGNTFYYEETIFNGSTTIVTREVFIKI